MSVTFTVAEIQAKVDELKVIIDDSEEQIAFYKKLLTMAEPNALEPVEEPEPEQESEIDPQ